MQLELIATAEAGAVEDVIGDKRDAEEGSV